MGKNKVEKNPSQKKPKTNLVRNKPPHLDDIYACLQCGYCASVCPVYKETGWESLTPRGKVFLLKHLIRVWLHCLHHMHLHFKYLEILQDIQVLPGGLENVWGLILW